ncbi:MAG: AAA family ATPase [Candidatus Dormibacteria bacterium]
MALPARPPRLKEGWLPALTIGIPVFVGRMYDFSLNWDYEQAAVDAAMAQTDGMLALVPSFEDDAGIFERIEAGCAIAVAAKIVGRNLAERSVRVRPAVRLRVHDVDVPPDLPSVSAEVRDSGVREQALVDQIQEVRHAVCRSMTSGGHDAPADIWTLPPDDMFDLVATLLFEGSDRARQMFDASLPERVRIVFKALDEIERSDARRAATEPSQLAATDKSLSQPPEKESEFVGRVRRAKLPPEVERAVLSRVAACRGNREEALRDLAYIESVPIGILARPRRGPAAVRRALVRELGAVDPVGQWLLDRLPYLRGPGAHSKSRVGRPLLLVGESGVGKTRRAEALARAAGLPSFTIPAGGMSDALSIRGLRSAYTRSQPGMIVSALIETQVVNLVLVLDEVDKTRGGAHGSPADALLHLLEPDSGRAWRDDFLEFPLDLSGMVVIATANDLDLVPRTLRDRFDVLRVPPYTVAQKRHILSKIAIPQLRAELGLHGSGLRLAAGVIDALVERHSADVGVRALLGDARTLLMRAIQDQTRRTLSRVDVDQILGPVEMVQADQCVICGHEVLDDSDLRRLVSNQLPIEGIATPVPVAVHTHCLSRPTAFFMANAHQIRARIAAEQVVWQWMTTGLDEPGDDRPREFARR